MSLMLSLIRLMEQLVVKVLMKRISLICFRVYLEVHVVKNPTSFSRWSVSVKDLAINGHDILQMGVPEGKLVGKVLHYILEKVVNEEIANEFDVEASEARQYILGTR